MRCSRCVCTAIVLLVLASMRAHAEPVEAGVSHALAISRAVRLSNVRYALEFQLAPHANVIPGQETLTFTDSGRGDLALDYRDGAISAATLNGKSVLTDLLQGHLELPASALRHGRNILKVSFSSNAAAAGKAFTRYQDRDDQNEYFYTLFVPMDASMAFPGFDQPDIKAAFTLQVSAPAPWTVIANTTANSRSRHGAVSTTGFSATRPISTYLFAFAAGPFEALKGAMPGEPTLYVRSSQLARAKSEAPQVQQMTARGVRYLVDYFRRPFPFTKYDLVLIPGFPFGGMEHAGATFLNEDSVLFRTSPTADDYFRRDILLLHETCHQWFGDLVTMRWFDDLWLKEGFAQYMAYKALATLEPMLLPWKHFYEQIKPAAYGIDETQGTTPIYQSIANLKDAKSAYGAIVYEKAPAVLKQLNFHVGEETFRDGLRLYLHDHAYANAQWSDLIGAFETASRHDHQPLSLQAWAKSWITQRGMPQVDLQWSCDAAGPSITLSQRDVLDEHQLWPISNEIVLADQAASSTPVLHRIRVDWSTAQIKVPVPTAEPCPDFVFANFDDQAYGRFLLDRASEKFARALVPGISDPMLRSMLWGALWDDVHVAQSAPSEYLDLVMHGLPSEPDESLAGIEGAHAATALHAYLSDTGREAYVARLEAIAAERMMSAPTLGLRIVNYRIFNRLAETTTALAQQKALLSDALSVPGMPLKPLDRWNLIGHLIAMRDPDAAILLAAEQARDTSGEGQKYAYAVQAGTFSADTKARYFADYLADPSAADAREEDWLTQSLGSFNSWNQSVLTEPYIDRALEALPQIKQRRRIFFLGSWLDSFIADQHSLEAQSAVHAWLARSAPDADLRLKVLEASDALDRTVMIRRRFP